VLLVAAFVLANCRFGYERVDAERPGGGGTSGGPGATSGGAGATNGGSTTPTAGSASAGAGQDQVGGGGGTPPLGGSAGAAGTTEVVGGAGGNPDMGTGGEGGAAGAQSASGCMTTPSCTCAQLPQRSYWFCENALNFVDAEAHCETQSMHLARVETQVENDFLGFTARALAVFDVDGFALIGANDRAVAGEWRWLDGTLFWQGGPGGAAVGGQFAPWAASSPSNTGIQECAGLTDAGEWRVRSCTALVPFICEAP